MREPVRERASALATLVWQCGFLAAGRLRRVSARRWSTTGKERVVVIAAHPDDEAIACSGTILLHGSSGDEVVVVIATDGRLAGAAATPQEVAALRRGEAEQAARLLQVERLEWLGLPEGAWRVEDLERRLTDVLERLAPTVVYAPSRVDSHLEHFAVAHAFGRALRLLPPARAPSVRVYQVQVPLTRVLTNLVADVSKVAVQAAPALRAYESQYGAIERVYRRRRYGALAHRVAGAVEEFWELSAHEYSELHRASPVEWGGKFRRMQRFAWTDPLAYLLGSAERRRLRLMARQSG